VNASQVQAAVTHTKGARSRQCDVTRNYLPAFELSTAVFRRSYNPKPAPPLGKRIT
jgi:hypothetical protein